MVGRGLGAKKRVESHAVFIQIFHTTPKPLIQLFCAVGMAVFDVLPDAFYRVFLRHHVVSIRRIKTIVKQYYSIWPRIAGDTLA